MFHQQQPRWHMSCLLKSDSIPRHDSVFLGSLVHTLSFIPRYFLQESSLKMTLLGTVATILYITSTATATGPAPSNVKIKGVSVLGSGCPAGTADVQVDATFSTYEVQTDPGTQAVHWRRDCKLHPQHGV
ncbi:uncharacterized protein BBA_04085 [Beauveria bassiana ARSEF 2860]|uniref:Uncharacterized protein n=1 Tax=Beauveria bassiana (strain ARSEF 2860) TaxID=655819 RepID=J4UNX4_BEAB2|nr:uncharacterized protein BBA_04085 [Beauveria bassiana ARSEF 2860]EJP66792.1 hypothetical protein BBA_04085 [Beauveria bassiana ARSEF 2860]